MDRSHGTRSRTADGIPQLSEKHWKVLRFMRTEYFDKGTGPTVRALGKTSGVSVKELYELFRRARPRSPRNRRNPQATRLHLRRSSP